MSKRESARGRVSERLSEREGERARQRGGERARERKNERERERERASEGGGSERERPRKRARESGRDLSRRADSICEAARRSFSSRCRFSRSSKNLERTPICEIFCRTLAALGRCSGRGCQHSRSKWANGVGQSGGMGGRSPAVATACRTSCDAFRACTLPPRVQTSLSAAPTIAAYTHPHPRPHTCTCMHIDAYTNTTPYRASRGSAHECLCLHAHLTNFYSARPAPRSHARQRST